MENHLPKQYPYRFEKTNDLCQNFDYKMLTEKLQDNENAVKEGLRIREDGFQPFFAELLGIDADNIGVLCRKLLDRKQEILQSNQSEYKILIRNILDGLFNKICFMEHHVELLKREMNDLMNQQKVQVQKNQNNQLQIKQKIKAVKKLPYLVSTVTELLDFGKFIDNLRCFIHITHLIHNIV